MARSNKQTSAGRLRSAKGWQLQDAKARFSELVRQAREDGPQRVTVRGRDAVVVICAEEFDRMRRVSGRDIVDALAASPLADVDFERVTVTR